MSKSKRKHKKRKRKIKDFAELIKSIGALMIGLATLIATIVNLIK